MHTCSRKAEVHAATSWGAGQGLASRLYSAARRELPTSQVPQGSQRQSRGCREELQRGTMVDGFRVPRGVGISLPSRPMGKDSLTMEKLGARPPRGLTS